MNIWISTAILALSISLLASAGSGPPSLADPISHAAALAQQVDAKIDVNRASVEKLQEVPGIGRTTAERIVAWRQEHGAFERLDDLLNVRGIGVKSLEKLRPYLTVGAAPDGGR